MIELIARLRSMADACKDATEAEAERIGEDHATLVPGVSGYFYDDLTAAAKALAASAQVRGVEAHCSGHTRFDIDCIDCSDALERQHNPAAEPVPKFTVKDKRVIMHGTVQMNNPEHVAALRAAMAEAARNEPAEPPCVAADDTPSKSRMKRIAIEKSEPVPVAQLPHGYTVERHAREMVEGHYPNHREYLVAAAYLKAEASLAACRALMQRAWQVLDVECPTAQITDELFAALRQEAPHAE